MKFLRYGAPGAEKPGLMGDDGVIRDLSHHTDDINGAFLAAYSEGTSAVASLDPGSLPVVPGQPRLGPCVGGVGKLVCIGLNYSDHAAETGQAVPGEPIIFMKATSAISGACDDLVLPRGSGKTDWEVELGVVIGKAAKYVDEDGAMDHVAGYCIVNDVSERELQIERLGQWTKGKSCDSFAPIGPWLVTRDAIADPNDLTMRLEVNGVTRQNGSTRTMIFRVPAIIAYLSRLFTLHPGDIISTGTPPGVGLGMTPPTFLKHGDVIRTRIDGLGEQHQNVIADM